MTTKQELDTKISALYAQLSQETVVQTNICSTLKASLPQLANRGCDNLAAALVKNQFSSPPVELARSYIRQGRFLVKIQSAIRDAENQLKALEINSSLLTNAAPTVPGEGTNGTNTNQIIRLPDSNIPDLPGFERNEVQQKIEDELNRKAGLAVDKGIAEREQAFADLTAAADKKAEPTKPALAPSTWGVKITSASSTYYMHLLPAISGNLNGTGHMDVPNVMPGLNFKFLSSYAKHKIPGWAPIYQALGIDTVLVTMIGMFTGEDGTDVTNPTNAPLAKGLTSPRVLNEGKFGEYPTGTAALNKVTNSLDTYENLQSFINFGVQKQQTLTIEVNIGKNGEIKPTSKTAGGIRGSNGNPTFSGIIRSLDTYYRRFDRTYYILTMEITKGIGVDCATKPLNLTNKLDEIVKSQLAKMENSCNVGVVENGKEIPDATPEEISAACYQYKKEGETVYAFTLDKSAIIRTFKFDYATNGNIIKTTPLQTLQGASAISFLRSNTEVTQRKGCNGPVGDKDSRIKLFVEGVNENYIYKNALPDINTLSLTGSPQRTSLNGSSRVGFDYSRYYSPTSQGYFVEIQTTRTDKLLSEGKSVTKIIGIPNSLVTFMLNNKNKEQGYTDIETFLNSGLLKRKDSSSPAPAVTSASTTAPKSTAGKP